MEPAIEPRKVRDFGEIINDTFVFIFQTWKPLLRAYITICGFFILAGLITTILQQFRMIKEIQNSVAGIGQGSFSTLSRLLGFEYLLAVLFSVLTYTAISLTSLAFIHLYKEKGNEPPTTEEVWAYVKFYFFRFLVSAIVLGVLLAIGIVLCILPGIYLWPIVALMFPIMMMENAGLGFAFSKAFTLIRDHWWPTFGVQFIIAIILVAASIVFLIPLAITGMGSFFVGIEKTTILSVVIRAIISQITMVFLILPNISIALSYYSLTEQKYGTSLMDRINNLGNKDTTDPALTPEEY